MSVSYTPTSIASSFDGFLEGFFTFFMYKGWIIGLILLVIFIMLYIAKKKQGKSKKELLVYKIFIGVSVLIILANIALWGIVVYALSTLDLSFLSVTQLM